MQAFMHLCLVRLGLLCGGEKICESKVFLKFLWYVDMGENYASQTRSAFDWNIPHLYNCLHPLLFYKTVGFFYSRLNVEVQVNFSPQFYVHINGKLFLHAFIQLCLVRLWLLCGGEKTVESNTFLKILWYVDMGEDYASQTRSAFDWNNPHPCNYLHPLLFYKTAGFFQSRLNEKVQVNFSPQFYVHINAKLFVHAFMHLCLVRLWLLCGGEKTVRSNTFLKILLYVDMGEDYASQTRSAFDWNNPHPCNYLHPLLFHKTVGFFSFSFERRSAGKFFTSILRSHKCEIIYTRFHAFTLSSTMALMWWRKNG